MKGKLFVIEGTDCSGKETQSKLLIERLNREGEKTVYRCFPNYKSTTGKIVGLPFLGKGYLAQELIDEIRPLIIDRLSVYTRNSKHDDLIVDIVLEEVVKQLSHGWFKETAPNVDAKVSSLYYAADRKYNIESIIEELDKGTNIVLDRYVYSNMAHQGCKIKDINKRYEMYKFIENLEFNLLELPECDKKIFLHMPVYYANILRSNRKEASDENELNKEYQALAEKSYLEVANNYKFDIVSCIDDNNIKTKEEIHEEVYKLIKK